MADHYIVIGDILFPKKYFHSMGLTVQNVKGEDGKPTDQTFHALRINLTEGQGFTVGGTRPEVEQAFTYVAKQLGVKFDIPQEAEQEVEKEIKLDLDKLKEEKDA